MNAPKHLSPDARKWFLAIAREYGITDAGGVALLTAAAESRQRASEAWAIVAAEGAIVRGANGVPVPHPALRLERDSRAAMLAALKQLHLDVEPLKQVGRPAQPLGMTEI